MATLDTVESLAGGLDRGKTPPFSWYTDPAIFDLERERIFKRTWQYAALSEQLEAPGDVVTTEIADVPIVLARGKDGELRAFVNVCRHRAHVVVAEAGKRSSLQCPYHGWTYGLDGCLKGAPRSKREESFDKSERGLIPLAVDTWGPMVFVNFDREAQPLHDWLGPAIAFMDRGGANFDGLRFWKQSVFEIKANWKVAIENTLECYHCPTIHPETIAKFAVVTPEGFRTVCQGYTINTEVELRESVGGEGLREDGGPAPWAPMPFVFPTFQCDTGGGPGCLTLYFWRPISHDRTIATYMYLFNDDVDEQVRNETLEMTERFGSEDIGAVENVQRGINARVLPHGELLPVNDHAIHYFCDLVFRALTGD
jgi:choline monooxygenase